jgi:outer membrane murein-binding lipoprotein Lpp
MTKNPIKLQDEIQRLKTNIRKIKKSVKALQADRQALVNAAKEAKAHLDNRDDADAWTVLDKALKIQEPK